MLAFSIQENMKTSMIDFDCHQCTCTLVKDKKWQGWLEAKKLGFVRFLQCFEISRAFFPPFRKSWKSWNVLKVSKVLKVWKVLKRKKMFHSRSWTELIFSLVCIFKAFLSNIQARSGKVWLKLGSFSGNFCLFGLLENYLPRVRSSKHGRFPSHEETPTRATLTAQMVSTAPKSFPYTFLHPFVLTSLHPFW